LQLLPGSCCCFSLPASAQQFNNPNGILFDSKGHLWLANSGDNNVLELSISNCTATILNTITNGISSPTRLAFDNSDNLWVTNLGNNTITVYNDLKAPGAKLLKTISNSAISRPLALAVDVYGDFYVGDNNTNSVVACSGRIPLASTIDQRQSSSGPGVIPIFS
jgi:DNA-binding beta-propeller fold protein YncE